MKLCKVVATVAATLKHPVLTHQKLLCVEPLDEEIKKSGSSFIAIDRVQAGVGDVVLVNSEGGGARMLFGVDDGPIRSVIVGVVDRIDLY